MLNGWFEFLKAAVKNPLEVSTIFPTRPPLARDLLAAVDFEHLNGQIIEVGCGTGAITRFIEPQLKDRSQYIGVEINAQMVKFLRQYFPYLRFEACAARDLVQTIGGGGKAQVVVSSLPWTMFSPSLQTETLDAIRDVLRPGGTFVTYICLNSELYPAARSIKRLLRQKFSKLERRPTEWMNIPPARVYIATK